MAIVWDFVREVASDGLPSGTTSFYDELAQVIYVSDGQIKTQVGPLDRGRWDISGREPEVVISDGGYSLLDIEHQSNGVLFGIAQRNGEVVFLVYEYILDASAWLTGGSWQLQPDSPIKLGSVTLINADSQRFSDDAYSIMSPGARVRLTFKSGESLYDVGVYHIEESPYSDAGDSFTFTGRNAIGFHLSSQTFDTRTVYDGTRASVFAQMIIDAGIPEYLIKVEADSTAFSYNAKPDQTILSGLEEALSLVGWFLDDLPDGKLIVGGEAFIRNHHQTGVYEFNRGSDVVSRSVKRSVSGVYSRASVTRGGEETARTIYADVPYFDGWFLAEHRTYYQSVPDETSDADMDRVLADLVSGLQYSGVTESFSGPFRPWIQTGDVAVVTGGVSPRIAGIITDVKHEFGNGGYWTHFVVTSGGEISNPDNPATIASRFVRKIGGGNRQRRLLDYITAAQGRR